VVINGNITSNLDGINILNGGSVVSNGNITSNENGIYLYNNGNITSRGTITAQGNAGIFLGGDGSITNIGNISGGNAGILLTGSGNVTSTGDVSGANQSGIEVGVDGNITSNGHVSGDQLGIYLGGNGVVDVRGSVHGGTTGISTGSGDQLIVINAVVTTNGDTAVRTSGGEDRVNLGGSADVQGDVRMGSGDDTVQLGNGSRVSGMIDGGDHVNGDRLIVGDESYCNEDSGTLDFVTRTGALVSGINLSGDTFEFDGNNYTVENFEFGESGVTRRNCIFKIDDGRINAYDIGAWVALYCNTLDGVNLWAIDLDGNGQADVSTDGATMRAALQQAVDGGSNVQVATGPRGTSLWALASNQYQAMGPDPRNPGQQYVYIFAPGTCGTGNSLET
jgi:hypothetical protein